MTPRQLCNYVYAVIAGNAEDEKQLAEFQDELLSPLDPAQAAAERAFFADINRGQGG